MGGNGGPGGGNGGGPEDDDDDYQDTSVNNKNNQHREFTFISPNKIVIHNFSGINLTNKFYLPFNKSIRE